MNKAVGKRVRRLRQEKELTQGQLARKAGITANTLRGFENGTLNTRWPKIEKVARALGTTAESLVHGDEPVQPSDPRLEKLTDEDLRIARMYHDSNTPGRNLAAAVLQTHIDEGIVKAVIKIVETHPDLQAAVIQLLNDLPHVEEYAKTSTPSDKMTANPKTVTPPRK